MKIYIAQTSAHPLDCVVKVSNALGIQPKFLFSYALITKATTLNFIERYSEADILIDSGAYSVWSHGEVIDIEDYIDFLEAVQNGVAGYFNLDVIGDANGSQKNLDILESRGFKPIPIFHLGSPIEVFDEMAKKYDYIGLGVKETSGKKMKLKQLNKIFSKGLKKKYHVLGVADVKILDQFRDQIYSTDTSSPINGGYRGLFQNSIGKRHVLWRDDLGYRRLSERELGVMYYYNLYETLRIEAYG